MRRCDVLVVGAGPAGCSAAKSAAGNGADTLLIDKNELIGSSVECAEGIGEYLLPLVPFDIPDEFLEWRIKGMSFWVDGVSFERKGGFWEGYTIDRGKFDIWLSELAKDKGSELWLNSELVDFSFGGENEVKKAVVKRDGEKICINPNVVIAADGSSSDALKLLGLFNPSPGDIAEVESYEMKNLNLKNPHLEQIYTGDFGPSGYGYIFPKSEDRANVGIGHIYPDDDLEKYFDKFLSQEPLKSQLENAKVVERKSGEATIGHVTDKWIYKNVILAGDSAGQNLKPFVEGILPSIVCGDIAGELASNTSKNDFPKEKKYRMLVEEKLKPHFKLSNSLIDILQEIYSLQNKKKHLLFIGLATNLFQPEDISDLKEMDYKDLKNYLIECNR